MKRNWSNTGRTPAERAAAHLRQRGWGTPLRRRVDIVLALLVVSSLTFLSMVWTAGVAVTDRLGLLDPPVVRPLADERLSINIRDDLAHRALLDAAFHAPERRIYALQEGGAIHTFDPATDLWTTERPFLDADLVSSDLTLLRSGCGRDPSAVRNDSCADPDTIWAMSRQGGLVRRVHGRWEVVVGDISWVGRRGVPVESDQVTAAALSPDRRWLLLGTREDGVGLYDNTRGSWVARSDILSNTTNPTTTTVIAWWNDAFWIGGPQGLVSLIPSEHAPSFTAVPKRNGTVIDLDAETDGLWVLERRACAVEGEGCLWLGKIHDSQGEAVTFVDERAIYKDLSHGKLIFAEQWGGHLYVAGQGGIFAYDPVLHSWERRFDEDVTVALALPSGYGFYFAFPGGVGLLRGADLRQWKLPGERVRRLTFGRDVDEVLAVTEKGNVIAAGPSDATTMVFQSTSPAMDPTKFVAAVDLGEKVLLVGPEGALLHDIVNRSYTDIAPEQLPDWIRQGHLRVYRADTHVYFLVVEGAGVAIYPVPIQDLSDPAKYANTLKAIKPLQIDRAPQRIWSWPGIGIGLIDAQGTVFSVSPNAIEQRTAVARPTLDRATLRDVTAISDTLVIASDNDLNYYDGVSRSWVSGPDPGQPIAELDNFNGQLLGRSDRGELLAIDSPTKSLIGEREGTRIGDLALSDARVSGGQIYLVGNRQAERYSPGERHITQRWNIPIDGALHIKAVIGDEPLVLGGEQAALGEKLIDPAAGPVEGLSATKDAIWTLRHGEANLYLKGYPLGASLDGRGARCFFRSPWTPLAVGRIDDARALPDGSLAVSTDTGLMFYAPSSRSWYAAKTDAAASGGRIYLLGDYLAVAEPVTSTARVTLIPLSSLAFPDSCTPGQVGLSAQTVSVRAAAFDEAAGRATWIKDADGAVVEWHAGQTTDVLAPEGGPDGSTLRRVYRHNDSLFFTTDNSLWRYDLTNHSWHTIQLQLDASAEGVLDIDIEDTTVTAQSTAGRWFTGQLPDSGDTISMKTLITAPVATFGAAASDLVDVAGGAGAPWTFLLNDRMKFFDPIQRIWLGEASFSNIDPSRSLGRAVDRSVAIGDGGATWWVATSTGSRPTNFVRYSRTSSDIREAIDDLGQIWRLDATNQLQHCTPSGDTYRCQSASPPPMRLDTASVRRAYEWEGLTLFEASGGLRAFNPSSGAEVPISGTVRLSANTITRDFDHHLLIHDGTALYLLSKAGDRVVVRGWDGVTTLAYDDRGGPWARFSDSWRRWDGNNWVSPLVPDGQTADAAGVRLFIVEGQPAVGLGADGRPYRWSDTLKPAELVVPDSLRPGSVDLLVAGPQDDWWMRDGGHLTHVIRSTCAPSTSIATPTPATTTSTTTATPVGTQTSVSNTSVATSPTTAPTVTTAATTTPTPQPIPCLVVRGSLDLPANFAGTNNIVRALAESAGLTLLRFDGEQAKVSVGSSGTLTVTITQGTTSPLRGIVADQWPTLQRNEQQLQGGGTAYDPIINLVVESSGRLVAERPTTHVPLANKGVTQPDPQAALDAGWLRWDRKSKQFLVAGTSGTIAVPREQFIVGGQLIFEPVETVLGEAPDRYHVVNQFGIWTYSKSDVRLDGSLISWQRIPLSGPMRAAHGRILTSGGDIVPGGSLQSAISRVTVTIDDIVIEEQIRDARVDARFTRGSTTQQGFGIAGFAWDRGRRGIAYGDEGLVVQTEAGIHPGIRLGSFDTGPPSVGTGRLTSEQGHGVLVSPGEAWYRRENGRWLRELNDPILNRDLFTNSTWTWSLANGLLSIALQGQPFSFTVGPSGPGYGFNFDSIHVAAAHDGQLFVMSEAFLETAGTPDALGNLTATRHERQAVDRFENVELPDGSPVLFRYDGGRVSQWDNATSSFVSVPASGDPNVEWRLVEQARLRMTWRGGQVVKEVRLNTPNGADRWTTFQFVEGHFPFDVVTSFSTDGNYLYVGSAAGLQVYSGDLDVGLDHVDQLYDLSGTAGGLTPVTRVGRPLADPSLVMARAAICVELVGDQVRQCADPDRLNTRLRLQTDFWRWTTDTTNALSGVYLARPGTTTLPVTFKDGRFPHDRVRDVAVCGAKATVVWEAGWVTSHPDATLALSRGTVNDALVDFDARRFVCLAHELRLPQGISPAGLYVEGANDGFLRADSTGWTPVVDRPIVAALAERVARPPIVDRARLRLLPPADSGTLVFEQQNIAGNWLPIPWDTDKVAADNWREILTIGDRLWVATPVGIIDFQRRPSGEAYLDPDSVTIVREPADKEGPCPITDLQLHEADVLLRCNSDSKQVYHGTLDPTQDNGIFTQFDGQDPFSEQILVSAEQGKFWRWRITGRHAGSQGTVVAERVGQSVEEPISLVNGRFDFDALHSLALFRDGEVEIASEGGWFTTRRSAFDAGSWKRPKTTAVNPTIVRDVAVTLIGTENQRFLCLNATGGAGTTTSAGTILVPLEGGGEPGRCGEYLGDDDLWRYVREIPTGQIQVVGKDGKGERRLVAGRFTDDIVIGLPVAMSEGKNPAFLVPTKAGVLHVDADMNKRSIISSFSRLAGADMPSALYLWSPDNPVYLGQGGLYRLGDDQLLVPLTFDLPNGATVEAIEDGPRDLLMARWIVGGQRGWSLYDRQSGQQAARNRLVVKLSDLPRFQQNRFMWGNPASLAEVSVEDDRVRLLWPNPAAPQEFPYPSALKVVAAINYEDRVLLFGDQEVYEVNIVPALREAFDSSRSH